MRFLLGGFGTRGDVQPMFALGLALRERGHQVRFVGPPDFASWASELRFDWVSVGENMEKMLARIHDKNGNMSLRAGFRAVAEQVGNHYRWMEPLVQDCDVIAAASLTAAGASLAEKYGKRYHYVAFCPQLIRSAHHPVTLVTSQTLPRWLNRLSWTVGNFANNAVLRKTLNSERARLGLPAVADPYSHVLYQRLLVASEPSLAPLPADLPPGMATQTGAWFMPESEELPADVEAFLAAGPPPVYVGFGSMQDPHPVETSRRVLEAVRLAGARVLLSRGWAGLGQVELPSTALLLGSVPHGKLFTRCAAVVHHGGAGTTVNATRAGVPQVVVPHAVDQFYWGHRVWRLGLSPPPLPKKQLRAEALAAAIRACLEDTGMRQRAASFAKGIRTDGLARAVAILEGKVKGPVPPSEPSPSVADSSSAPAWGSSARPWRSRVRRMG